tara:strand:+ start:1327 stop:1689 length:363 start_codon:yes stop_codon:yes gene_type:complete
MTNKTEHHKKGLIEALEKSLGVVTIACRVSGVGRTTYYEWYNEDKEFRIAVDDIKNVALDFAETQLHTQIRANSTAATIFYLKTQGKGRGYIERQEFTGVEGMPSTFKIEIIDRSDDTNE